MIKNHTIFNLRYKNYINDITLKRINKTMFVSIVLLTLLMYLDISVRNNIIAVYARILSLALAIFLLVLNNLKSTKNKPLLTGLYNFFLATIPAMMFAKFLIHLNSGTAAMNVLSIITAIFIISLEVRASLINTLLIYLVSPILFVIILFSFFSFESKEIIPLINVLLMTVVGFTINRIQNNLRKNNFKSGYLLNMEREKLKGSNKELKIYHNKLEELVSKKTESLEIALKKAKESDELKTSFLQNVSHEIRTPLNAVFGFMHLLAEKNIEIKEEILIIDNNLTQLLKTVDDILLLSELQSGQYEIKKFEFENIKFLKEQSKLLETLIKNSKKSITPICDINYETGFIIDGDKEVLSQIFRCSLENAVKFSKTGEIKITGVQENNHAIFKISDNGTGIAKKDLPHVFETFRKFEGRNNIFRGVGIGLSIVKELVDIHSGEIYINSEVEKGTTIEFRIPNTLK